MKRKAIILALFIACCLMTVGNSFAQNMGLSTTGVTPDNSAMLDIVSSDKGLLIPRMTEAQRNLIPSPALGLQIFNTTTNCFNFRIGNTWKQICGDCDFNSPVVGNNGPICQGSTLNLTATTILGATYQWSGPNGFTSTLQNPSISNATAAASGSYSATATKNNCTCQQQSTVATVNTTPVTPMAGNDGPTCIGDILNLTATTVVGATYIWTGPNGYSASVQNPTISSVALTHAGTYNVIATVNGCASAVGTTTVSINTIPATPGSITGPASACPNSTGNVYSISAVSGATSYTWTIPSGTITAGQGTTFITVTFGTSFGNITVTASNVCGTSSASSLTITNQSNATGGTITSVGGYTIHTFTTSGTFTSSCGGNVEVLVVAGGGGGGWSDGASGPGGAGGLLYNSTYPVSAGQPITVTVGDGGTARTSLGTGNKGGNSVFGSLIAIGGGGGSGGAGGGSQVGGSGGSGGGGGYTNQSGGSGTSGQGNMGGTGAAQSGAHGTGGGGGAGAAGTNGTTSIGGNGGAGVQYSISGTPTYYAGGGGGGVQSSGYTPGTGGIGGGGNGSYSSAGTPGSANTGGGGGGGVPSSSSPGGSGIVIIRY